MPLHYALTDGLVLIAAVWGVWQFVSRGQTFAAFGLACFGLAALVGVIRITTGLIEPLAPAHRLLSQLGGTAGVGLLVSQIATQRFPKLSALGVLVGVAAIAILGVVRPALVPILSMGLLLAGIVILALRPETLADKALKVGAFGLLIPVALLFRKSPALSADLSWHLYHCGVAFWIVASTFALNERAKGLAKSDLAEL
jgi:hypothetical protein